MLTSEQNASHVAGHMTGHVAGNMARAQSAGNNERRRSDGYASSRHGNDLDPEFEREIHRFAEEKKKKTMKIKDEEKWRVSIKEQLEAELNRRVREALETPPSRVQEAVLSEQRRSDGPDLESLEQLNSHVSFVELQMREKALGDNRRWKVIQTKRRIAQMINDGRMHLASAAFHDRYPNADYFDRLGAIQRDEYEELIRSYANSGHGGVPDTGQRHGNRSQDFYDHLTSKADADYGALTQNEKLEYFYAFTKDGFREAVRSGRLPDGSAFELVDGGRYRDRFGVARDEHGPFWPPGHGPLYPAPCLKQETSQKHEPLITAEKTDKYYTVESNPNNSRYSGRWRGVMIIFDSEKSVRDYSPRDVSEGLTPSLVFESRFECGNLRQARRIGAFEYELVLKTDLYTTRHTQWYYFRIQGATPGVTYKFKIINLHKRDSLYNHGMRPLIYSEKKAQSKNIGWERVGHHIVYSRNTNNLQCPLLARERSYYTLEWQMEFQYGEDVCYLAHCYPYTFTDLRDDLDILLADPDRSKVTKRQVLCETRAGNSCFLVTVTNFDSDHSKKKAVVVTARVHPGETNSSWMMKGLLEYVTGSSITAKQLRNQFIFKIIPMLNPDGVIVGNYRCSLTGRDLNRNYRHPRKESFPTVWYTKAMMEEVSKYHEIILYCDLHGHSRKHNVFMYGCNLNARLPVGAADANDTVSPENYLQERLFPWLMSQKSPDKFWFRGCKFQVRKCKEATGRVVMFRQMNISNSFTMEATFCGTTICRGEQRHFNVSDYEDMGQAFCEVVLEYHQIQQNKARQSEVVLELTRAITQQILETRGLLPSNIPDITTEAGKQQIQGFSVARNSGSDQIASNFVAMVTKDKSHPPTIAANQRSVSARLGEEPQDFSGMDVNQLLDTMSSQTMDGCAQLLEQLHIAESIAESDSSDSDSESEPEMKFVDVKPRRRKKKNKKKRQSTDGEVADKSKVDHTEQQVTSTQRRAKTDLGHGLPAIDADQKRTKQNSNSGKNARHVIRVNYPSFVNKYVGRSNGGIPCFSEERLLERASKRMRNMKKKLQEAQQKEAAYYITMTDEDLNNMRSSSTENLCIAPFQRVRTHNDLQPSDLRRQFNDFLQCGSAPDNSHDIRVGYVHAAPELERQVDLDSTSLAIISTNPMTRGLTDSSDSSDVDDIEERASQHLPLTAVRTPYQNVGMTGPAQTGMMYSHHRKLGRLPALTHKMTTDGSCSIPRRHSISTNMMVTSLSAGNDKMEAGGCVAKGASVRVDGTTSEGNTIHTSRHGLYRKQQLNHSEKSAGENVLCPQGTALGLMSREYTELLLHRLRNQKSQKSNNHGNVTALTTPTGGSRHSTCE